MNELCSHEHKQESFWQDFKRFETLKCSDCDMEFFKCLTCGEFLGDGEHPDTEFCCHPSESYYADLRRDWVLMGQIDY